jgi:hypothetical protein
MAAYIGLMTCLAVVVALGEACLYSNKFEWIAIGSITAVGVAFGMWRDRLALARNALLAAPVAVLFAVAVMVVMALPRQGEWIVGGWDPGTYVDQGVFVSREGTFRPAADPLFSSIKGEDWPTFVPRVLNFAEALPVFPIDPDTHRFEFFFFRGMPAAVAVADRCGGLRAATRVNMHLGLLALLAMAHVFWTWFGRRSHRWFALALVVAQPVWLYHLHFPTSELLQQALWFGLFGVAAIRAESRAAGLLMALGCLALTVTHLAVVLFLGLFLMALAWCDLARSDRVRVRRERIWQVAAVLAGVGVDLLTSPATVGRLEFILPRLLGLAGLFLAVAVAIDYLGSDDDEGREAQASTVGGLAVFLALSAGSLVVAAGILMPQRFSWPHYNLKMIVPYVTPGLALLAVAGLTFFVARREDVPRLAKATVFLMVAVTIANLVESAIASLYPWATRRYVALSVPLFAVLAGHALAWLWQAPMRWMRPAVGVVFVAVVTGLSLWSWPALTRTEYDGLSAELEKVAARIGPKDVVVADRFAYGIPLRFLHGRHVLDGERMAEFSSLQEVEQVVMGLENLHRAGWTIRFLTVTPQGMNAFPMLFGGLKQDWQSGAFVVNEIEHDAGVADYRLRNLPMRFALHTWDPAGGLVVPSATNGNGVLEIDIGVAVDTVHILGGFHGRETLPSGRTVRWTKGEGVVAVRGVWTAGARVEVDYVDRYCPGGSATGGVALAWDDVLLKAEECSTGPKDARRVAAGIPAATGVVHRLRIAAAPWSPRESFGSPDARVLGVMVDRVRVMPSNQSD